MVFSAVPVSASPPDMYYRNDAERLWGADRFETSRQIAFDMFSRNFIKRGSAVVVASGQNYHDAIVAASLAGALQTTVLLWPEDPEHVNAHDISTVKEHLNFLRQLRPDEIYVIGKESAVPPEAIDGAARELRAKVIRIAGKDRYDTAALVAERTAVLGDPSGVVFVVSGQSYADAISVGAASYALEAPIILADPEGDVLPARSADAILDHVDACDCKLEAVIVGGTAAVNSSVELDVEDILGTAPIRLWGTDRYETNHRAAEWFYDECRSCLADDEDIGVVLTTGSKFPDALSGAGLAASKGWLMLLVPKPDESLKWLKETVLESGIFDDVTGDSLRAVILGGPAAVADDIGLFEEDFQAPEDVGAIAKQWSEVSDVWLGGYSHNSTKVRWILPVDERAAAAADVGHGLKITVKEDGATGGAYAAMWGFFVQDAPEAGEAHGCGKNGRLVWPPGSQAADHNGALGKLMYLCLFEAGANATLEDAADALNSDATFSTLFKAEAEKGLGGYLVSDLEGYYYTSVDANTGQKDSVRKIRRSLGEGITSIGVFVKFADIVGAGDFKGQSWVLSGECDVDVKANTAGCTKRRLGAIWTSGEPVELTVDVSKTEEYRDKLEGSVHDERRMIYMQGEFRIRPSTTDFPGLEEDYSMDGWALRAPSYFHAVVIDEDANWSSVRLAGRLDRLGQRDGWPD